MDMDPISNRPSPQGTDDHGRHGYTPAGHHDHDDGLVHDHSWACSERGRMAH